MVIPWLLRYKIYTINRKNYVKNSKCYEKFGSRLPCRSIQSLKMCSSINGTNSKSLFFDSSNDTGEVPSIYSMYE